MVHLCGDARLWHRTGQEADRGEPVAWRASKEDHIAGTSKGSALPAVFPLAFFQELHLGGDHLLPSGPPDASQLRRQERAGKDMGTAAQ